MAGVRKLLKQAQKMQQAMEAVQQELEKKELSVSAGGGAVQVIVTGAQQLRSLTLDPEFLKEDKEMVEETIMTAIQEAIDKSKAMSEEAMNAISGGMSMGGLI